MKRYAPTAATAAVNVNIPAASAPATGAGNQTLASTLYIQSRGQNLITNGTGLLGSDYNFTDFTFDPAETYMGAGSFRLNAARGSPNVDEYIPVDPGQIYRLSCWGKSGEAGGTNYNPVNRQYLGVFCYDADKLQILPANVSKYASAVDTTLAVALNPGDLTFTLTDSTGWNNGSAFGSRQLGWWPYINALGYSYPTYVYTRNHTYSGADSTGGLWLEGGISGNVITLRVPWARAALPAGTPVKNTSGGTSYIYLLSNFFLPNDWTFFSGYIGGSAIRVFSNGTAYVRPMWLIDYHNAADNNTRWSNVWFGEANTEYQASLVTTQQDDLELLSWIGA